MCICVLIWFIYDCVYLHMLICVCGRASWCQICLMQSYTIVQAGKSTKLYLYITVAWGSSCSLESDAVSRCTGLGQDSVTCSKVLWKQIIRASPRSHVLPASMDSNRHHWDLTSQYSWCIAFNMFASVSCLAWWKAYQTYWIFLCMCHGHRFSLVIFIGCQEPRSLIWACQRADSRERVEEEEGRMASY